MTCIIEAKSKRRLSARLAAGLAISAFLVLGTVVASASTAAQERRHTGYSSYRGHGGVYRGGRGYYAAPPVVYGSPYYGTPYYGSPYYGAPYYYPPPVVYGPAIGIGLPGIGISIF